MLIHKRYGRGNHGTYNTYKLHWTGGTSQLQEWRVSSRTEYMVKIDCDLRCEIEYLLYRVAARRLQYRTNHKVFLQKSSMDFY